MALAQGAIFTKPESFAPSSKRAKQFSIYAQLLPISLPPAQTFLSTFLSSLSLAAPLAQPKITAVYDEITHTIWVQGEQDMTILWRRGFFGKGALSRSEPSWKRRVENKIAEIEGGVKRLTSEEITAQRRVERHASKLVKKAERESEKLIAASAAASEWNSSAGGDDGAISTSGEEEGLAEALNSGLEKIVEELELAEDADHVDVTKEVEEEVGVIPEPVMEDPPPAWQLSAEHTQLQQEEAFFLLFALGCITITTSNPLLPLSSTSTTPLSILATWRAFLLDSATLLSPPTAGLTDPRLERFDSPFLINYAAYHHFRSMGWVARSGVKFCADWVLYGAGGPVGGHAEFAVVVVPTYADPADALSCPFRSNYGTSLAEGESKNSWRWFNTVNRVCSGVKKTLVLLYVVIPPMSTLPSPTFVSDNPAQAMARLQMREVTVRRWIAGRSRD